MILCNKLHPVCICGHYQHCHADIDDGTMLGYWGAGKCELCECKKFECASCRELRKNNVGDENASEN